MTLCMLKIDGPDGLKEAQYLMHDLEEDIRRILQNSMLKLNMEGLKTFGQRVLYADVKPEPSESFTEMYDLILSRFGHAKHIHINNKFEYHPHMTLLKVNRAITRVRNSKYLPSYLYEDFRNTRFGIQPVDNVQLCVLEPDTRSDGFYTTVESYTLMIKVNGEAIILTIQNKNVIMMVYTYTH